LRTRPPGKPIMTRAKRLRILAGLSLASVVMTSALILGSDALIEKTTRNEIFTEIQDHPERQVGLVLGCSRYLSNGGENPFFKNRMARTVQLYQEGKIQQIIVSGDNSRKDYDEPSDMRDALVEQGIPEGIIYRDYAGFSTLDSIVRAKEVFKQSRFIVISQEFHARRAVYIGKARDIDVVGSIATDVLGRHGIRTHLREYLARVKTILDVHILNRGPKFLGEPVVMTSAAL